MDPRKDLPSALSIAEPQQLGPEATSGNDEVEKYLGMILDAFTPEVPTVSQLETNPNLPWVLAGRQQVVTFVRSVRDCYRRQQ